MNSPLLLILLAVPTIGAIAGVFLPDRLARQWALLVSVATFIISAILGVQFFCSDIDPGRVRFVFGPDRGDPGATYALAIPAIGFAFSLGVDSISVWLVLLTTLLTPLAIAASFGSIKMREKEYYAWMLALLTAMLGVFVARDLLLFYVFFELTLVPMFFIIGIWGGPDRRTAAGKFFLFTFAGSVFTLAAVIYVGMNAGAGGRPSFDMDDVVRHAQSLEPYVRFWLLLGLLAGFAVKVPLFPVHTWLPLAHTEAPTAGSVILAGVLLKLGTYGILRLALPIGLVNIASSPDAVAQIFGFDITMPGVIKFMGLLCVIGIIYGALVAWVQQDIKKLVAYSSVSHLGFCVLGLLALNDEGMQGSVLYMINHGLSTGAMFLVIGMIYDRYHTRDIDRLSGLAKIMPRLAFFFVLFTMSSIGLPPLNGFASEFLTILGAFKSPHLGFGFGAFAALGVILGAVYMLHMTARVIWGPLKVPDVGHDHDAHTPAADAPAHGAAHAPASNDIGPREIAILTPLAILVVVLGVYAAGFLRPMRSPVQMIQNGQTQTTYTAAPAPPAPAPQPAPLAARN